MKIIFLNKYQGKVNRGAETFINELSKRLGKHHEVEVISKINYLYLLKIKYDIVIPTNGRLQVFIIRLISWIKGAKMIVSGQSGPGLDDRINLYVFPDVFIGLTNFQSNWANKVNPYVKVRTIPNGVDLTVFKVSPTNNKNKTAPTVLGVGAFTWEKGHELTIAAVALLPRIKLTLIGSGGAQKDTITRLGNKLLKKRFNVLSLSHKKMPEAFKTADLFVYPTVKWESFGIAMVEAMASGLPVVATDDPIRREVVGDAGLFVDPTNTKAYSEAIQKVLDINWGVKPRKQAEKFSWDKIANEYEELINSLMKK